jgi:hypothetical protein
MTSKFFVTALIEDPDPSYLSGVSDAERAAGFGSKWAEAAQDGYPPEGSYFWDTREEAQEVADQMKKEHVNDYFLDFIEVKEL